MRREAQTVKTKSSRNSKTNVKPQSRIRDTAPLLTFDEIEKILVDSEHRELQSAFAAYTTTSGGSCGGHMATSVIQFFT